MREAFLVGGVRTPVGRYGGALSGVRADDLAALVVGEAVRRAGVDPEGEVLDDEDRAVDGLGQGLVEQGAGTGLVVPAVDHLDGGVGDMGGPHLTVARVGDGRGIGGRHRVAADGDQRVQRVVARLERAEGGAAQVP